MHPLRPLVLSLAQELGTDAEYVRPVDDRRYLTGVEVGLFLAVGIVIRFMDGYLDGLIKKQGEKLGERHAEAIKCEFGRLMDRFARKEELTAADMVAVTESTERDLAGLLEELLHLLKEKDVHHDADHTTLIMNVNAFLVDQGFPAEIAAEHGPSLVIPIEAYLARERGTQG
jgi:hypothetical protein